MFNLRAAGIFALAFAGGVLVTALYRWPPTQSSDWAAWVQAVGSIGAVIGAFAVARHQMTLQMRSAADVKDRSYRLTVEHAVSQVLNLRYQAHNTEPSVFAQVSPYFNRQIDAAAQALSAFVLSDLKSTNAIFQHLMLIQFLRDVVRDAEEYAMAALAPLNPRVSAFRMQMDGYSETTSNIRDLLIDAMGSE